MTDFEGYFRYVLGPDLNFHVFFFFSLREPKEDVAQCERPEERSMSDGVQGVKVMSSGTMEGLEARLFLCPVYNLATPTTSLN